MTRDLYPPSLLLHSNPYWLQKAASTALCPRYAVSFQTKTASSYHLACHANASEGWLQFVFVLHKPKSTNLPNFKSNSCSKDYCIPVTSCYYCITVLLLHHYYISISITVSLLRHYYNIITTSLHHNYNQYYIITTSLLHYYYIITT